MKRFLMLLLACLLPLGTACFPASASYTSPIAGDNGLLVVSPEEYFDGAVERTQTGGNDDQTPYYSYIYFSQGAEGQSSPGNDDTWALFIEYKDALIDSGYYEQVDYKKDNYNEYWILHYIGPESLTHFGLFRSSDENAAIVIHSLMGRAYVFYAKDIRTTNYEEAYPFGTVPSGNSSGSSGNDEEQWDFCTDCSGHGNVTCTNCWGSGQVSSATSSSGRRTCGVCSGRGNVTCSKCGGSGKIYR